MTRFARRLRARGAVVWGGAAAADCYETLRPFLFDGGCRLIVEMLRIELATLRDVSLFMIHLSVE